MQALVLFHVVTFSVLITTRKRVNFQGTFFVILCKLAKIHTTKQNFPFLFIVMSIGLTEKINEYMAANYKKFYFTHQYFDSHGMFISLVYSAPALVNCVIILVRYLFDQCDKFILLFKINWFSYSSQLLVSVKQQELKGRLGKTDSDQEKKLK